MSSSETQDLRDGIQLTVDIATIPLKTVSRASDAHTAIEASVAIQSGAYADAAIMGSSLLFGDGAAKFLKRININNKYIQNAAGLGVSKATEHTLGQDCFTCTKYD